MTGISPTPLGIYYDALCTLSAQERTALAEAHACDSTNLRDRFLQSVESVRARPGTDEPFHDSNRASPPCPPIPPAEIESTIQFVSHVCDEKPRNVVCAPELGFLYVDREIFPARTKGEQRASPRKLDLLLRNANDAMPIVGEFKRRNDRDAYFALAQCLMHASEFQSPSQLRRLQTHPGGQFQWPARGGGGRTSDPGDSDGPFVDVYLIAFKSPERGKYRARSYLATAEIARNLVGDLAFSRHVRRIAYLEAMEDGSDLAFHARFCEPRPSG